MEIADGRKEVTGKEAAAKIGVMLNMFPQSQNTDRDVLMVGLDIACEGISNEAIVIAATQYIQGKVKDQSLTFAPSAAEFAVTARRIQAAMPEKTLAIAPPIERKFSAVHKAEVARRVELLAKASKRGKLDWFARANANTPFPKPTYADEVAQ